MFRYDPETFINTVTNFCTEQRWVDKFSQGMNLPFSENSRKMQNLAVFLILLGISVIALASYGAYAFKASLSSRAYLFKSLIGVSGICVGSLSIASGIKIYQREFINDPEFCQKKARDFVTYYFTVDAQTEEERFQKTLAQFPNHTKLDYISNTEIEAMRTQGKEYQNLQQTGRKLP